MGARHVVLVGLMGVGKSTVGRVLASQLGRPLYDSDEMIVERTGRTVREIWTTDGEPAFRAIEREVLLEALAADEPSVIAAAGGVVLRADNRAALRDADARVVWLRAGTDVLTERAAGAGHRPLLDDDPGARLARMADERGPLYQEVADAIVSVDQRSVNEVVKAVRRCIV